MYHPDLGYVGDGPPETEQEAAEFKKRADNPEMRIEKPYTRSTVGADTDVVLGVDVLADGEGGGGVKKIQNGMEGAKTSDSAVALFDVFAHDPLASPMVSILNS